jgi:hypothetical protein
MTPEEIQRDRERLAAEMEREVQRVREYILYGKMPEHETREAAERRRML